MSALTRLATAVAVFFVAAGPALAEGDAAAGEKSSPNAKPATPLKKAAQHASGRISMASTAAKREATKTLRPAIPTA